MKNEITNRFNGDVVFSADAETFRDCVLLAISQKVNLSRANLSGANLSRANLSGANLSGANLSRANLSRANLSGANLSGANLSGANLSRADLSRADLSRADLSRANLHNTIGNTKEIKTVQTGTYIVNYTKYVMQIGCENHSVEDWFCFDDKEILEMEGDKALKWWVFYKPILKNLIEYKK